MNGLNTKNHLRDALDRYPLLAQIAINAAVSTGSLLLCTALTPLRLPGLELLGVGVDWPLIWVVSWSVGRLWWVAATGGTVAGLLQDGMTGLTPSHAWGLALVGFLAARLHPRSGETAWVMMALTTFVLVAVSETVMAAQFAYLYGRDASDVWTLHQRVTLCSAILSSLWSPIVSLPLSRWWRMMESLGNRP